MNPLWGRDTGPRPPFGPVGRQMPQPGAPYTPHSGMGAGIATWPLGQGPNQPYYFTSAQPLGHAFNGWGNYQAPQPMYAMLGSNPFQLPSPWNSQVPAQVPIPSANLPYQAMPSGQGAYHLRLGQCVPQIDRRMPAAHMTNSTGGTGCEPGYNYFFPAEHTKVHALRSTTPPWQVPPNTTIPFVATHVPCSVTGLELLKGFGCNNPVPKKNICTEVTPGGNGTWYKGITISGDNKDQMKMTIKELGWNKSRTGRPGEDPVVCLWFQT